MDINWLAADIKEWADSVFPGRTDASMFLKLYKEIGELIDATITGDNDAIAGECADLAILLLDFAKRKGINPSLAIQEKLAINRGREWRITPIGVMQHVKSE